MAAELCGRIESGAVAPGEFLPSVKAIAAAHGVAVGTAHRAVAELVAAGLVEVVPGRGTRVCVPAEDYPSPPTVGPSGQSPASAVGARGDR